MKKSILVVLTLFAAVFLVSCGGKTTDDYNIVVFYTGENAKVETVQVKKGEKLEKPTEPVSEDADFGGWYTDLSFEEEFTFDKEITESTTVYAKWVYLEYTINYQLDANTENDSRNVTIYKKSMGRVRLYGATKEGSIFRSWHLTPELDGPAVLYIEPDEVEDGMTLYPKWR